ncbi:hypothetical protein WDW37_17180, partial [Bdellovibrionota bacterium FG-1]
SRLQVGALNSALPVAGECLDIMSFQSQLLKARGFPNTYTLVYGVPGGIHGIALAQDPANAKLIHAFSYKVRADVEFKDGAEALFQSGSNTAVALPDTTLHYYLAKPAGAVIADVPSEMGKFLTEAAGSDIHTLDPLARTTSSMIGASESFISSSANTTGRTALISGQDGNQAQYLGASGSVSYAQNILAPGKVALVLADQLQPSLPYATYEDQHLALVFLQIEQHLKSREFDIADKTLLQFDGSATGMVLGGYMPGLDEYAADEDLRLRGEARVDQELVNGHLQSQYRVGVAVSPSVEDLRQRAFSKDVSAAVTSTYVATSQTVALGEIKLLLEALASIDHLGTRGIASIGIKHNKFKLKTYAAGRITDDTALYQDNSIRRAGFSAEYEPLRHVGVGIFGEMPIEGANSMDHANLSSTLRIDW